MKKNKILIVVLLSLVLCGCDAHYDIKIRGNKISEKITVQASKEEVKQKAKFDYYYDYSAKKKYNVRTNNDKLILYNNKAKFESLATNNLSSYCFDVIEATETKESYTLGTSEGFSCIDYENQNIDEIVITLNTFNKVTEHNADETKFGKYIWYIDNYNYKNKRIYFSVKKNDYLWYYRLRGLFIGLGSVLLIVIIGAIIIKVFKTKSNEENKI